MKESLIYRPPMVWRWARRNGRTISSAGQITPTVSPHFFESGLKDQREKGDAEDQQPKSQAPVRFCFAD